MINVFVYDDCSNKMFDHFQLSIDLNQVQSPLLKMFNTSYNPPVSWEDLVLTGVSADNIMHLVMGDRYIIKIGTGINWTVNGHLCGWDFDANTRIGKLTFKVIHVEMDKQEDFRDAYRRAMAIVKQ